MKEESVAAIGIASTNPEIRIDSSKDTDIRIALNKKSEILNDDPEIEIDSSTMKGDAEFRIDTAIGIDLGCSYSRVSVCLPDGGKLEIVPNVLGNTSTPCYVTFGENEHWVGEFDAALTDPKNTIFDSKRFMGRMFNDVVVQDDWPFEVVPKSDYDNKAMIELTDHRRISPERISAVILSKMKEIAEEHLGHQVTNAVISVPTVFDESQRQATWDAGKISGLHVLDVINEEEAVALVYELPGEAKNVWMIDVGGCSTCISIIEDNTKTNAHWSIELGGRNFDKKMLEYLVGVFEQKHGKDIRGSPRALSKLLTACERAKRVLSVAAFTTVIVDSLHEEIDFELKVTRSKFEALNSDLFKEFISHIESCLNCRNMPKTMIDDVFLIGGSSRIPKLKQLVQEFFEGKKLHRVRQPDDAVAHGAALHAAKLNNVLKTKKMLENYICETRSFLLDKKSSSLSLSLVQEIDSVMEEIGDATRWLEEHKYDDDSNSFTNKRKRLQTIWNPVIEAAVVRVLSVYPVCFIRMF